ncbi:MAG TPA: C39 family peptidase [Candidatus Bathyarchaeia archaeon]|nr:C39 family peptidase [Candidatus Bathyarchaeia archaeon]
MRFDIPFVKNSDNQCGQACTLMILKYFYPKKKISFGQINKIIHGKPDKYTWPFHNAIALDHFGIKAKAFSKENFFTGKKGLAQFKKWFGKNFDYLFKKWVDWPTYEWGVKTAKRKNLFKVKTTPFEKIEEMVKKGNIVIVVLDWNTLNKIKNKPYEGHLVIITGLKKDQIYINEPDEGRDLKYPKKLFKAAYNHPVIKDNLCVVYGKK